MTSLTVMSQTTNYAQTLSIDTYTAYVTIVLCVSSSYPSIVYTNTYKMATTMCIAMTRNKRLHCFHNIIAGDRLCVYRKRVVIHVHMTWYCNLIGSSDTD